MHLKDGTIETHDYPLKAKRDRILNNRSISIDLTKGNIYNEGSHICDSSIFTLKDILHKNKRMKKILKSLPKSDRGVKLGHIKDKYYCYRSNFLKNIDKKGKVVNVWIVEELRTKIF